MAWKALLGWPHVRYFCMLSSWSVFPRSDPGTLKPSIPFILWGQHAQEGSWCSGKKNPLVWPRRSGKQGYPAQGWLGMAAHQEEGKGDGAQCLEDPYLGVMGTWADLRLKSENWGNRCLRSVRFQIRKGVWYGHRALLTEKGLTGHRSLAEPPPHPAVRQGTMRRRARGCGIHMDQSPTEQASHALATCLWTSYLISLSPVFCMCERDTIISASQNCKVV